MFGGTSCPVAPDGTPAVDWIAWLAGSCVYGNASAASWLLGIVSFVAWLGAQLPQVVENYVNQSVEGLSLYFLLNWFIGDATNFLGCILTHQLPFQTVLSAYYVCIDLILASQYFYYSKDEHRRQIVLPPADEYAGNVRPSAATASTAPLVIPRAPGLADDYDEDVADAIDSAIDDGDASEHDSAAPSGAASPRWGWQRATRGLSGLVSASFVASFSRVQGAPVPADPNTPTSSDGSAHHAAASSAIVLGQVFAWICALFYLTSRMPQIYKNYCRQSTWGTATLLFCAALIGNVTYTLSILLSPEARGPHSAAFLLNELPFLVGSAGTVCFDLTILGQRVYYGKNPPRRKHLGSTSKADGDTAAYAPLAQESVYTASAPREIVHRHPPRHDGDQPIVNDMSPLGMSLQTNYHSSS